VEYEVQLAGDASPDRLKELAAHVDAIAEIPNSVRDGTEVRLASVTIIT
jgi:putative redox protein